MAPLWDLGFAFAMASEGLSTVIRILELIPKRRTLNPPGRLQVRVQLAKWFKAFGAGEDNFGR